jgi:putative FmdB family regulatory protein
MPIYEYACQDCHQHFEALVRSDTVPSCPKCQSTQLEKLLSVPAKPMGGDSDLPAMPAGCGGCPGAGGGCPMMQ